MKMIKNENITNWYYKDQYLYIDNIPKDAIAFVYRINHIKSGKWYIGRKCLTKTTYKQINGKRKKIKIPNDWPIYWSSSIELQSWVKEEGEENFIKEILFFTASNSQTLYLEEFLLYSFNALIDEKCLNNNIRAKIFRKWFLNKQKNKEFVDFLLNFKLKYYENRSI
jgi:hypothetical protein